MHLYDWIRQNWIRLIQIILVLKGKGENKHNKVLNKICCDVYLLRNKGTLRQCFIPCKNCVWAKLFSQYHLFQECLELNVLNWSILKLETAIFTMLSSKQTCTVHSWTKLAILNSFTVSAGLLCMVSIVWSRNRTLEQNRSYGI